jgi:RNA polymerase sigma-70 factor (ECF subfamily)
MPETEKELLLRVAEGDEHAFRRLFYSYHHSLGIFIYQLTASRELAEEIVQDVFLKIWLRRADLAAVKDFSAWLFIVSRNHALNTLRKQVRERQLHKQWEKTALVPADPGAETPEPTYQLLYQAIHRLPEQQKKVFVLSRFHSLKHREIARELNLSKETVKSYLRIALASIARFVGNRHFFFSLLLLSLTTILKKNFPF